MKKCKLCGKKGLFLKLDSKGNCQDCIRLAKIKSDENTTLQKILEIKKELANVEAFKTKCQNDAIRDIENLLAEKSRKVEGLNSQIVDLTKAFESTTQSFNEQSKGLVSLSKKALNLKSIIKSIQYVIENYYNNISYVNEAKISELSNSVLENISPTIELKLHCMDVKGLRKAFNDNKKLIKDLMEKYQGRYTTKANATIYSLIILALEAELQNILFNLRTQKQDEAIADVKSLLKKLTNIACDGNQSIAGTIVKFLGQLEIYYIEAVKIEYEYFVLKEKIKEEQRTLREQMKQEAEERKILEQQQKQMEKEESKYTSEIEKLKLSLGSSVDTDKNSKLQAKIDELERLLLSVETKKAEIVKLQNGKAGYVYVISNLGSFGEDIFKIGMTRRLEPQDRVDELGNASVPFSFDVHSFIFSNDAVGLEYSLHNQLKEKRVNKINMRKEFFNISLESLEQVVLEREPSAEFKLTMLAEQYRQSISLGGDEINFAVASELACDDDNED